ncbi:MAG: UDP-3-O-(3-hydroxymyristoyl)glucosamine N-acyltransferase [Flavobacteriaceae bacterium]
MKSTALEIAKKLNGSVEGDSDVLVTALAKIEDAPKGSLSFLANTKYSSFLSSSKASVILIQKNFKIETPIQATLIRVSDPYAAFTSLLIEVSHDKKKTFQGIHKTAIIDPSVKIGKEVYIGPYACIEADAQIGSGVQIHAHTYIGSKVKIGKNTILQVRVSLMNETEVGEQCIIHSGVVIGCDGFGFVPQQDQTKVKIPQLGNVIIKDKVEIGANTTIDRATLGSTIIHEGVKLDNLVQIAHNVEIGPHTVIAAQSGVAGSSKVGARCVIGGQVGIIGHLTLGDDVQIQGQTGVISNIPDKQVVQGTPAMDFKKFYKSYALFKRFPDFESRLSKLEKLKL